jgi:hypothetical protein
MQGAALIRVGAGFVLAVGGLIAFAVATGRRPEIDQDVLGTGSVPMKP